MSAWSRRPASPSWAARSGASTSTPRRSSACAAARCRSTSRGWRRCWRATRERLHFSTDIGDALANARLLFVAVGTPPTYSGDADLAAVHAVVDAISASERARAGDEVDGPLRHRRGASSGSSASGAWRAWHYVSCPEFLKEGTALKDFRNPDRVVVGDNGDWAGRRGDRALQPARRAVVRTDIASAEMIKLAANAFLATKISFINEIANVCEETGADVIEVARGVGLDDRIGPSFLQAGIGYGGSLLHQGRQRAEAAGGQLRLPLPAAERRDRGQRAAEAPGRLQAAAPPRRSGRQAGRHARPGLQAGDRRHARGLLAGARRSAAGRGRDRPRLRPDRRGGGAAS